MRINRIELIEKYISEHNSATLEELCNEFAISKPTLRRDLDELSKRGSVKKVYGGVIANTPDTTANITETLLPFAERNIKNMEIKEMIAREAAKEIQDNDTIYIDTGTSTANIIDHLSSYTNITIITNSIYVANKALLYDSIHTIMLPGQINTRTASTTGLACLESLKSFHINKAFMACTALNTYGASNSSPDEFEVKKVALQQSKNHFLLADHSKFDKTALMSFTTLDNIHILFTDESPSDKYIQLFKEKNILLKLCK